MAYNLHRNIEKNHNRYQSDSKRPLQFSGELFQINVLLGWAQANVGRYQTNHTNNKFGKQEHGLTENVTWDTSPDTCLGSQKPVGPPGKARCHVDEIQERSDSSKITQEPGRHNHLTSPLSLPKGVANSNRTTWKWKEVKGKRKWCGNNNRMPRNEPKQLTFWDFWLTMWEWGKFLGILGWRRVRGAASSGFLLKV